MRRRTGGTALIVVATLACAGFVAWGSRTDESGHDRDPANRPGYAAQPGYTAKTDSTRGPKVESPDGPESQDGGSDQNRITDGNDTGNDTGDRATDQSRDGADDEAGDRRYVDHVVTGEIDGRKEAVFAMIRGSEVVRVRSADLGDDLYRITTPDDSKIAPSVHLDDDTVFTSTTDTGQPGPAIIIAELNNTIRWHVRLGGGANEEYIDLTTGKVNGIELSAGTSRAEINLPPATGTTTLTMSGGASQLLIHLHGDNPVQVHAGSGAGTITIDKTTHAGVAGGTRFTPTGWKRATNRYNINAAAGVANLTIDRR